MPLYHWRCKSCGIVTRALLEKRPALGPCECDGRNEFVSNTHALVIETRDNGIMPRKVEQIQGVEDMVRERSQDSEDPGLV